MIRATNATLVEVTEQGEELYIANLFGASSDSKPTTGYANGSTFVEVNTGKLFLFNEAAQTWVEVQ